MKQFLILISLSALLLSTCQSDTKHTGTASPMIGVKVYDMDADKKATFEEWEALGINTVFTNESQMDVEFRELARQHDIKTFIILPIFFAPEALREKPDLFAITDQGKKAIEEWVEFVCPSRTNYRKQKIEYIKSLVRDLQPDGISLDFIRHFVFWEKVYPDRPADSLLNSCFDSNCLEKFQQEKGLSIPDSLTETAKIADWIKKNYSAEWTRWKCDLITSMIADITAEVKKIDASIKVNVHTLPWRENDFDHGIQRVAGQELSAIAPLVDMISPMTYAHMVKRTPEWISDVVQDVDKRSDIKIVPSIQVNKAYLETPLTLEEFEQSLKEALKAPSSGVIFWSWEQLNQQPKKKKVVKLLGRE